jgi:hypothetical protein
LQLFRDLIPTRSSLTGRRLRLRGGREEVRGKRQEVRGWRVKVRDEGAVLESVVVLVVWS